MGLLSPGGIIISLSMALAAMFLLYVFGVMLWRSILVFLVDMERHREIAFPQNFRFGVNLGSPFQVEGEPPSSDYNSPLKRGWWNDQSLFTIDTQLAQDLGVKIARIGVEWARIEPQDGQVNKNAVRRYREMLKELKDTGIEAMVTIYHFTLPKHIADQGGWANPAIVSKFREFSSLVADEIAGDVPYIITMNEPSVFLTNGYLKGEWPPNLRLSPRLIPALINVIRAHNVVYENLKKRAPNLKVGASEAIRGFVPRNTIESAEARIRKYLFNTAFFRQTRHDFHGVNYFGTYALKLAKIRFSEEDRPQKHKGDDETLISPEHFLRTLEGFYRTLKKPIIITENGISDEKDRFRPSFILSHLLAVHKAIEKGIPIEGYLYWSLTDNYEWFKPLGVKRFGLVGVDFENMIRSPRRSYALYQEICRLNAVDIAGLSDRYLSNE